MKISKLQVTNFRNLEPDVITFGSGINCIFGDNGNGKTNILEALYYIINRKSFRKNTSFPQIISLDGENNEILFQSVFDKDNSIKTLSGKLLNEGATWFIDGKPTKKKIGAGLIFINPFDSQQFHTSPSFRRNWLDTHLSQLSETYKKNLSKYTKHLKNRNILLQRKPFEYKKQIIATDQEMAKMAVSITEDRVEFIEEINKLLESTFYELFSEEHLLTLELDSPMVGKNEIFYCELMNHNWKKDDITGRTSYGIHRDDYVLLFDGLNSFDYCSLGQQKTSYLSLLFAYTELFLYKFKTYPIVLIDDVSGELDSYRWQKLINYLKHKEFQVLITTANNNFRDGLDTIDGAVNIQVASGSIQNI